MTLITLVRHGQTDWNLARRIQGSTDIPLNETGRADARTAAGLLADTTHHAIYSSPLVRDVREREFGEGEGMLVADYLEQYGDWLAPVPGAETLEGAADRALAAIDAIARDSRRRSAPLAESVIVVAHGGVIRSLIDHVSGGTLPRVGEVLANGSVHRFEASPGSLRLLEHAILV